MASSQTQQQQQNCEETSSVKTFSSSPSPSISSVGQQQHAVANLLNFNPESNNSNNNLPALFSNTSLFHSFNSKYSSPAALMAAYQSVLHQLNFSNVPSIESAQTNFTPNIRSAQPSPTLASNYQFLDLSLGRKESEDFCESNEKFKKKSKVNPEASQSSSASSSSSSSSSNSAALMMAKKRGLSDVITQLRNNQQVKQENTEDEDECRVSSKEETDENENEAKEGDKKVIKSAKLDQAKLSNNKAEVDLLKLLEKANLTQYLQAFTEQGIKKSKNFLIRKILKKFFNLKNKKKNFSF